MDPSATTTALSSPTSTADQKAGSTAPSSSPLLFFVALGFGVVFTNLWIIVGVKYCFRHNRRNRLRAAGRGMPTSPENHIGAVDLLSLPRPRRRREKKLMTLDEVDKRFPVIEYRAWRCRQAAKGLPTDGGVAVKDRSRSNSLTDIPLDDDDDIKSASPHTKTPISTTLQLAQEERAAAAVHVPALALHATAAPATLSGPDDMGERTHHITHGVEDDGSDVEDDPIDAPAPLDILAKSGDNCAICIDTIEDDEMVRGLTCGHAFHAACVDPWLTSRRACCPLCKADYYTPKTKAESNSARPSGVSISHPALVQLGFVHAHSSRRARQEQRARQARRAQPRTGNFVLQWFSLGSRPTTETPSTSRAESNMRQRHRETRMALFSLSNPFKHHDGPTRAQSRPTDLEANNQAGSAA